jgi:ribonuclease HI
LQGTRGGLPQLRTLRLVFAQSLVGEKSGLTWMDNLMFQQEEELKEVVIYTDGGCDPNPGAGGYGVILIYANHKKEMSGGFCLTTNNRMELFAAIAGLEALKYPCKIILHSDSRYVVNAIAKGWARKWRKNGWWRTKKEKAVNIDLWEKLLALCEKHEVDFKWVKGHADHKFNERCDMLATAALKEPNLPADEGYEQRTINS